MKGVRNPKEISSAFSQGTPLDVGSLLRPRQYMTRQASCRSLFLQRLVVQLNNSNLGCFTRRLRKSTKQYDKADREDYILTPNHTDIEGTTSDGRSIYIMVINRDFRRYKNIFMRQMYKLTPHVGYAFDYGDCYDIVKNSKRKQRTFKFLEEKNGKTKISSGTNENE